MKKILITLVCLCSFLSVQSQTIIYQASYFAYKYIDNERWTDWTKWYPSKITISINLSDDIIKIYSEEPQTYVVTKYTRTFSDKDGGKQSEYRVIDQYYDKGIIRLRIESNGTIQLYVDFSNVMWVYSGLKRI